MALFEMFVEVAVSEDVPVSAIGAAVLAERERCAKIADAPHELGECIMTPSPVKSAVDFMEGYRLACSEAASRIRSGK